MILIMSSWLPSGLTSLTGQISSFTKEVLSEGTEEIDGKHLEKLSIFGITYLDFYYDW